MISALILSSVVEAQSTEELMYQIANLLNQLTVLQSKLESSGFKLTCNANDDCAWCGVFCTNKAIARYCLQIAPLPGYSCVCEAGRCIAKA